MKNFTGVVDREKHFWLKPRVKNICPEWGKGFELVRREADTELTAP